jgi:nucleoside-diphosphate-sugar epimerase
MNLKSILDKKIFVTGHSGFIGSHIIKKLPKSCIVNSSHRVNLLNRKSLLKLKRADIVIHVAGRTPYKNKNSLVDYYDNNFLATLNVLEYCIKKRVKKLIYVSTYVYGNHPQYHSINEDHPVNPHTPYTESKYLGERLCKSYSDNYDLQVIILRPFNIFGKSATLGSIISNLINALKTGREITIINKNSKRDFLFVDDFVDAVIKILDLDVRFEIFNVGSGISYSFIEIMQKMEQITGKKFHANYTDNKSEFINEIRADITKIKKHINWNPVINLEKGLRILLEAK